MRGLARAVKLAIVKLIYYILNKYERKNIRLMFTDTDSLIYEIKTEDAYKDLYEKKRRSKLF